VKIVAALSEARLPRDIAQGFRAAAHRTLRTPSSARVNATVLVFLVTRNSMEAVSRPSVVAYMFWEKLGMMETLEGSGYSILAWPMALGRVTLYVRARRMFYGTVDA